MMQIVRSWRGSKPTSLAANRFGIVLLAALAGGCSADITRFDYPAFDLSGDKKETTTASLAPIPSEPVNRGPNYLGNETNYAPPSSWDNGGYTTPTANSQGGVQQTALDAPVSLRSSGGPTGGYNSQPSYNVAPSYAPPVANTSNSVDRGDSIQVQSGDTLYGLSRRYQVSVAELMQVNSLSSPTIRPGQTLYLPAGISAQSAPPRYESSPRQTVNVSPAASARYNGSYTMQPGDSIYAIARSHGVTAAEMQRVNGISDPRSVRVGTVLKVPTGSSGSYETTQETAQQSITVAPPPASTSEPTSTSYSGSSAQPTVINRREVKVATRAVDVSTGEVKASGSAASASDRLRWPVQGRIITSFGQRSDGTHSDGINVSVPVGTPVHASEGGVVAYAGSELKGYGKLVLLRHDNGWVTAYAHAEELKVQRGDRVRRGQVIATAGRSGAVDRPQLHFELRQGSKPVDPVPYLEPL